MILMTQKIGDGPMRRCDARCYGAKGGVCDCICGGRNHGTGISKALDNVHQMFAPVVECEHGNIIGNCPHGCYKPAGRATAESDKLKGTEIEITGRAQRALRHERRTNG